MVALSTAILPADHLLLPLWRPTSVRQRERGFYNILYYWIILVHPRKWWPLIGLRTSVTILKKGSGGKRPAYETLNATKGISSRSRGICCYLQTYTARTSSFVLSNAACGHTCALNETTADIRKTVPNKEKINVTDMVF